MVTPVIRPGCGLTCHQEEKDIPCNSLMGHNINQNVTEGELFCFRIPVVCSKDELLSLVINDTGSSRNAVPSLTELGINSLTLVLY